MSWEQIEEDKFYDVCPKCGNTLLFFIGVSSCGGIASARDYMCFICDTVLSICPPYDCW
jgi:hypothetical protein